MAASAAGLNHLISSPKKVQVHFGQDKVLNPKYSMRTHFSDKCLAIVNCEGKEYFAISGVEDYQKKAIYFTRVQTWANEVNQKLFDNKAQWCNLSDNTCNYIKKTDSYSNIKESNFEYIGPSLNDFEKLKNEYNPEQWLKFYTCCERKILGFNSKMKAFDLFVLKKPRFRCSKALFSKVKTIYAYFEKLNWKDAINKGNHFKPKEYYISQIFESKEA